ncbi:MAG: NAD(P)/FAD-dependent oxidoreductase [Clostridia bacterium]|nr:NAD(P)/FAD-dependent oxidoreductase [Clostridia bacterium]
MTTDVIVIGGGPAGMAAAVAAAENGASVILLEKNAKLGMKLNLTGRGRCNVTNRADTAGFQAKIWRNPKFVLGSLHRFSPDDLEQFLASHGLRLKEEDSGRMFPITDRASDVTKTFRRALKEAGVQIETETAATALIRRSDGFLVRTTAEPYRSRSVVLAAGGLSYPSTGSTGDGFAMAKTAGHSIIPLQAALVGFESDMQDLRALSGLTLKGIDFTLLEGGRVLAREEGELLFTRFGVSGPAVFRASCAVPAGAGYPLTGIIDLKPRLSQEELERRIVDLGSREPNKEVRTVLEGLMPRRLTGPVCEQADTAPRQRMNQLSREQRRRLAVAIKGLQIRITSLRPVSEAIITSGGIPVSEINPKTMESRLVPGLFFAGEMIDVSAMTGGYNLQIAFSTGWDAGRSAAAYCAAAAGPQN